MEYTRLGNTGLKVSRITLGCMSFGDHRGFNEWSLDEPASEALFRQALDLGITFWDTANVYQLGSSEEYVGRAIAKLTRRENLVVATKLRFKMHDGPGGEGLSRKAIMEQIDASLRRLGTDYVDVYQIHRFDEDTPIEETMEALHDVVKSGKARYLGASSMYAWQFAKMQSVARRNGWTPFVSMQNQYSLMMREDEKEMYGLLADEGVGSIPYSPVAKGRLTRPWGERTARFDNDPVGQTLRQRVRPSRGRGCAAGRRSTGAADGPDRPRLGLPQPGGHRPDRGTDQAPPPQRRRRRPRRPPHRRRGRDPREPVRTPPPQLLSAPKPTSRVLQHQRSRCSPTARALQHQRSRGNGQTRRPRSLADVGQTRVGWCRRRQNSSSGQRCSRA